MIRILPITTEEGFAALEPDWDPLLRQSPVDDAFLTWEWLHTWWKYYGSSYQLWVLAAYEGDLLVGIAPLMLETQNILGLRLRIARNIGVPAPDVGGLIVQNGRADILKQFAAWLVEHQAQWDVLWISEIPPGGMDIFGWTAQFPGRKFAAHIDTTAHYSVPIDGDWNKYAHGLPKNLRKNIHKQIRRLQEGPGYQYHHKQGPLAGPDDIQTVFRINQKARYIYLYSDPAEQDYHQDLAERMASRGWLDIHYLCIGETPAAFRYGFRYNQCYEAWRTGFDGDFAAYSPGKVLLYLILQDGFEHGLKSLNFLSGDEDSKLDWQVDPCVFSHLRVVRRTALPLIVHVYYPQLKNLVRDFLKRHESLHPLLKEIGQIANHQKNQRAKKKIQQKEHPEG